MFITTMVMALLSAVVFCIWKFAFRGFGVVEGLFAVYGYVRFTSDLCHWIQLPDVEILRRKRGGRH